MFRINVSDHAYGRWLDRVGISWSKKKISGYIYARFMPELRKGIKTYSIDNQVYYILFAGEINEKLVFAIITPDSRGLWSGWSVITFLTDDMMDSIGNYYDLLYKEVAADEDEGISKDNETERGIEEKEISVDMLPKEVSEGGLMYLIFGFSYDEEGPNGGFNDLIGWSRTKEAAENFADGQEFNYETIHLIKVEDIPNQASDLEVI